MPKQFMCKCVIVNRLLLHKRVEKAEYLVGAGIADNLGIPIVP